MADDLTSAELDIAFAFSRPIAASFRNAAGATVEAAAGEPRFDHDAAGNPLGLLIEPGPYPGAADRAIFDELMLPADIAGQEVTVFHHCDYGSATVRRAYYSRNAAATIDALMRTAGRHRSIGVILGFRVNKGGFVRYRGESWDLPRLLGDGLGAALTEGTGFPIVESGAERPE